VNDLGHSFQHEHKINLSASVHKILDRLANLLQNFGWNNIEISGFGLTADLFYKNQSCFTIIITCIPEAIDETELLITICSNEDAAASNRAVSIICSLQESLRELTPASVPGRND